MWANKIHITHDAMSKLITILRSEGQSLPKDGCTVRKTPHLVPISEKCGGQYVYLGTESGIISILERNSLLVQWSVLNCLLMWMAFQYIN
jgi:hypothetical protein